MLKTGTVIDGKYKILNEIGHGGMSTVYLAINEKANKPWAIKEIRKRHGKNFEILRQSLTAEINTLKKLEHPNLPRIVDVIDNDDDLLIVMDYIEGNTLDKLIAAEGHLPQDKVVSWGMQLCGVLQYLHSQQPPIIYRDMKPANIMLRSDGTVVLIDFGTAREYKQNSGSDTTCLGTKGYAAPEQFGGMGQTDARTDIYCLGTAMYHLLTGHNPSEPPYEIYPITKWRYELSSGLEKIILKCTEKNPDNRYQNADELMYALMNYHDMDTQMFDKYKKRLKIFACALIASGVCALGSAVFGILSDYKLDKTYRELLQTAEAEADKADKAALYIEAIDFAPQNMQAYIGYCNAMTEDEMLDSEEEASLVMLNASHKKYLKCFADKHPKEYADFCYDIGNAYWYFCDDTKIRKNSALPWFETAAAYYGKNKQYDIEYQKCLMYMEMGNFAQKVTAAQIEGNDIGIYYDYWNTLMSLKALNDIKPESDIPPHHMCRELISCVAEYAGDFKSDNVPKEELLTVLDNAEKDAAGRYGSEFDAARRKIDRYYDE